MSLQAETLEQAYSLEQFVADTRRSLKDKPGPEGVEEVRQHLEQLLRDNDIDKVTVVGLATDYCVKHTALEALRLGFEVEVDSSAVRGVNVQPGDDQRALDEVRAMGGVVT